MLVALALVAGATVTRASSLQRPEGGIWDNVQKTDCRIWAKRFDPFELEWKVDGGKSAIVCATTAEADGKGKRWVKVSLSGELIEPNGVVVPLGTRTARTDQIGLKVLTFPIPPGYRGQDVTVRFSGSYRSWRKATVLTTECLVE